MSNRDSKGRFIKGHKLSKKSIQKLSDSLKGKNPWNKNLKGDDYKKHYKNGMNSWKKGNVPWNKGKKCKPLWPNGRIFSEKTKIKMSLSKEKNWKSIEYRNSMVKVHTKHGKNISNLRTKIRGLGKCFKWKADILKRDNYHCNSCGSIDELQIDHIIPLKSIIKEFDIKTIEQAIKCKLLWDSDNGRVLCKNCHKKTDTYGGSKIKNIASASWS